MRTFLLYVVYFILLVNNSNCLPITYNFKQVNFVPLRVLQPQEQVSQLQLPIMINANQPKGIWNAVGDFITSTGFFPIEINVPDTVGTIVSGAQNVYAGISSTIAGVPATVGTIVSGAQNVYTGISSGVSDIGQNVYSGISGIAGNVIQRIPLFQGVTSSNNPRPLKSFFVLVPLKLQDHNTVVVPMNGQANQLSNRLGVSPADGVHYLDGEQAVFIQNLVSNNPERIVQVLN